MMAFQLLRRLVSVIPGYLPGGDQGHSSCGPARLPIVRNATSTGGRAEMKL